MILFNLFNRNNFVGAASLHNSFINLYSLKLKIFTFLSIDNDNIIDDVEVENGFIKDTIVPSSFSNV